MTVIHGICLRFYWGFDQWFRVGKVLFLTGPSRTIDSSLIIIIILTIIVISIFLLLLISLVLVLLSPSIAFILFTDYNINFLRFYNIFIYDVVSCMIVMNLTSIWIILFVDEVYLFRSVAYTFIGFVVDGWFTTHLAEFWNLSAEIWLSLYGGLLISSMYLALVDARAAYFWEYNGPFHDIFDWNFSQLRLLIRWGRFQVNSSRLSAAVK